MAKKTKKSDVKSVSKKEKSSFSKTMDDNKISVKPFDCFDEKKSSKINGGIFFVYLIAFVACGASAFLYNKLQLLNMDLQAIKNAPVREEIAFQDTDAYKNLVADFEKKFAESEVKYANNFVKYEDAVLALRMRVHDLENNRALYNGPYLVVLTMFNQLRAKIDSGESFESELRAIEALNLQDEKIQEFIKYALQHSHHIPTLNQLQNHYAELVSSVSFNAKNPLIENPSFIQKIVHRFKGVIKIRDLRNNKKNCDVDCMLEQISSSLIVGDLNFTAQQMSDFEKKYPGSGLLRLAAYVGTKQKIDNDMQIIFNDLLQKIYADLQKKNS
ncbi:MAG: hypothetical protein LBU68_01640 [Rickettsiales bacterium]|jgi:hypothetical protein|nr:hypothetical protein [Rickettsiales bacterium]